MQKKFCFLRSSNYKQIYQSLETTVNNNYLSTGVDDHPNDGLNIAFKSDVAKKPTSVDTLHKNIKF